MIEDKQKMADLKARHQEEYKKFRQAINNIAKTSDGEIVLRHIAKLSGFFKSPTVVKGGQGIMNGIDVEGTMINIGRESVYLDMRRPMNEETRRLIESRPTVEEETNV